MVRDQCAWDALLPAFSSPQEHSSPTLPQLHQGCWMPNLSSFQSQWQEVTASGYSSAFLQSSLSPQGMSPSLSTGYKGRPQKQCKLRAGAPLP